MEVWKNSPNVNIELLCFKGFRELNVLPKIVYARPMTQTIVVVRKNSVISCSTRASR